MRQVRIVVVGDVDAGKSTILGRLLVDLGQITAERLTQLESSSTKRGVPIEYSFLLDAFQVERDQAITLDITRVWVRSDEHDYVFVDAPGHRELIRNLISGASQVDAAILVVAADEGITWQTRRQALFLQWLGFSDILVAINKLDLAQDARTAFAARAGEVRALLDQLHLTARDIVPVTARSGDNIVSRGPLTQWWQGSTLFEALTSMHHEIHHHEGPLRLVVQDVYRRDGARVIVGRVESGTLRIGETITFWPLQTSARVTKITRWPQHATYARAGEAVAIELESRIFVDRGAVATHAGDAPHVGHVVQATIVWLATEGAAAGEVFRLRLGTRELPVTLARIDEKIDPDTLDAQAADRIGSGDVAVVTLVSRELIAADTELERSSLGRFILLREQTVVAGGRISAVSGHPRGEGATNIVTMSSSVESQERSARNGHRSGVFWLTGLPSSGKSTIAMRVQRMLFDRGRHVYVLDGDTLRTTLNVDLGFSDDDRSENVRRAAAVAGVFADAGFVVISALISPSAADRERAREAAPENFYEVYISCDLSTAEGRDVKGHYRRARLGEMANFTGISSPYDVPGSPDLTIDTMHQSSEESAAQLLEFIEHKIAR